MFEVIGIGKLRLLLDDPVVRRSQWYKLSGQTFAATDISENDSIAVIEVKLQTSAEVFSKYWSDNKKLILLDVP